jgi:hypothetical protein
MSIFAKINILTEQAYMGVLVMVASRHLSGPWPLRLNFWSRLRRSAAKRRRGIDFLHALCANLCVNYYVIDTFWHAQVLDSLILENPLNCPSIL